MKDNKILKLAYVLFVICAATAAVLGIVHSLTAQRIYDISHAKEFEAYAVVLKSDNGYAEVEFEEEGFPTMDSIMVSNDGNGYVVKSTFSGAQGSITMVCGVDNDLKCTGISIIEHSETSGLGAVAASSSAAGEAFRAQFVGQDGSIALSKNGGEIDALAGATITSTAVTEAVATSIAAVDSVN